MFYDYTVQMSSVKDVGLVYNYNLKQRLWEIKCLPWMYEINTSVSTVANSFTYVVSSEKSH